jgi:hypothetical protein
MRCSETVNSLCNFAATLNRFDLAESPETVNQYANFAVTLNRFTLQC